MRIAYLIPLLLLAGACDVDRNEANDTTTVEFNETVAGNAVEDVGNAAEDLANGAENLAEDVANEAEETAEEVENEVR
jgi:hypothetical protein